MDGHISHTPTFGVRSVYYVDVSLFDYVRITIAVVDTDATWLHVQFLPEALIIGADMLA